jgi:hypothetical protein
METQPCTSPFGRTNGFAGTEEVVAAYVPPASAKNAAAVDITFAKLRCPRNRPMRVTLAAGTDPSRRGGCGTLANPKRAGQARTTGGACGPDRPGRPGRAGYPGKARRAGRAWRPRVPDHSGGACWRGSRWSSRACRTGTPGRSGTGCASGTRRSGGPLRPRAAVRTIAAVFAGATRQVEREGRVLRGTALTRFQYSNVVVDRHAAVDRPAGAGRRRLRDRRGRRRHHVRVAQTSAEPARAHRTPT